MDSYRQTSTRYSSSCVESPLSVNSHRGRPADYSHNESSFGPTQRDGCQNPENGRENGKHNYALGEDVREEGQRQAFVGILDVYVHHARDIHNICIYDKQDVYAKLSLTSKPDGAFPTQIANGGGRNPVFNESLQLKINSQLDTSLRCEVWMLSRARNYLEDQLLGFALVPLATVVGKGKVTQDFELSSTDLFHSPAGIVQLTLSYHGSVPSGYHSQSIDEANLSLSSSTISSENGRENGKHNYALGEDVREEGQRQALVGILDVYVHHARDIHNICIYNKQDVYAKLSLTSEPDGAFSTQIANGGGRNPVFNESLQLKINSQLDTSLKCEVWMLSRARNYLEDQMLGFALVPLATVVGKGKVTQDFALSSTDLFHSPAGIVQLTLSYHGSVPSGYHSQSIDEANLSLSSSTISSEAILLDHGMENSESTNYNDIEFPDLQIARENHQMVSEFIKMASDDLKPENSLKKDIMIADSNENEFCGASFSQLGAFPSTEGDYDMTPNVTAEKCADSFTGTAKVDNSYDYGTDPDGENSSFQVVSSTTNSSSEGQCPRDFVIQKGGSCLESSRFLGIENPSNGTSLNGIGHSLSKENLPSKDSVKEVAASSSQPKVSEEGMAVPFTNPLVSINLEPEQTVVQQQIVDMYMKSMQQFTESLAKMKLPMDIENKGSDDSTKSGSDQKNVQSGRNGGSRVFYGSRAFF